MSFTLNLRPLSHLTAQDLAEGNRLAERMLRFARHEPNDVAWIHADSNGYHGNT